MSASGMRIQPRGRALAKFKSDFGDRFLIIVERTRFTVFGNPTDELRQLLDGFGATYLKPFNDFAYWA